jgi:F420-non-reducing hydrogenase iron-sulfur subunit
METHQNSGQFEPRIVAFLCNWCSYAGADLAGTSRVQYPPNIRVVRVLCSGRVEPSMILQAFAVGADGVMVLGCHLGDCHYISGNYYAERKIRFTHVLLNLIGIRRERLLLDWVSAAEGWRFAKLVTQFTHAVKNLGSLRGNGSTPHTLDEQLAAAVRTAENDQVRWIVGKWRDLTEKENVYGEKIEPETFDELLHTVVTREFRKEHILVSLTPHGSTAAHIAGSIGVSTRETLFLLTDLLATGRVKMEIRDSLIPVFKKL